MKQMSKFETTQTMCASGVVCQLISVLWHNLGTCHSLNSWQIVATTTDCISTSIPTTQEFESVEISIISAVSNRAEMMLTTCAQLECESNKQFDEVIQGQFRQP